VSRYTIHRNKKDTDYIDAILASDFRDKTNTTMFCAARRRRIRGWLRKDLQHGLSRDNSSGRGGKHAVNGRVGLNGFGMAGSLSENGRPAGVRFSGRTRPPGNRPKALGVYWRRGHSATSVPIPLRILLRCTPVPRTSSGGVLVPFWDGGRVCPLFRT